MSSSTSLLNRKIPIAAFLLQLLLLGIMSLSGTIKYIFGFGVIIFGFLIGLTKMKIDFGNTSQQLCLRLVFPFLLVSLIGLTIDFFENQALLGEGLKQSVMYLEPAVLAAVVLHYSKDDDRLISLQFISTIIIFLITAIPRFNSTDLLESTAAFSFGLFALYYLAKGKGWMSASACVLLLLANKRIALGAIVLAAILFFILKRIKAAKGIACFIYFVFCITVLAYTAGIFDGTVGHLAYEFHIETMGRLDLYSLFNPEYNAVSSFDSFGYGLGYVITKLQFLHISNSAGNLHNDWLSLFIELGYIGVFAVMLGTFLVVKKLKFSNKRLTTACCLIIALLIYWQTLYFTDNVTLYIFVLYPFYTIVFSLFRFVGNRNQEVVADDEEAWGNGCGK